MTLPFTQYRSQLLVAAGLAAGLFGLACARPLPSANEGRLRTARTFERNADIDLDRLPAAGTGSRTSRRTGRADDRSARVLSNANLTAGVAFGARSAGDTPLDQLLREGDRPLRGNGLCPPDMASINDRFCVDRFEASLVEILPNGEERGFSPYESVEGRVVRAVSERSVVPQAYVSGKEAKLACARSGKRLCKAGEWRQACMGSQKTAWGYGASRERGRCNDNGRSPMGVMYGPGRDGDPTYWNGTNMNNPELNKLPGTLAKTGEHAQCTNDFGVYDMVGNLHEWVDDPRGRFQGGYYQDVTQNGDGCDYKTKAHENWYHDYSTGFRCCADVAP